MDLAFAKYNLSNGLTLFVKENHHAQSVVIRGHLQGGANLDPPGQDGLASFTAAVMRRGTAKRTFAEINETLEAVAANVYVSSGRHLISFGGKSLAEDFNLLLEMMTDILLYPVFPTSEMEKARGQIITGLKEAEDSPRSRAGRYFREILYTLNHPYGHPSHGTLESIPKLTRDDLLSFYQRTFYPHAGALVVVGDVISDQVYQTLETSLGQWQPDHPPPEAVVLPEPRSLAEIVCHIHPMPNKSQADLILGNIGPSRWVEDYYAAEVGDTILGHLGLGGRIGQSVRDKEGLAYYARTNLGGGLGRSPWLIYAGINPMAVDKAVDLILTEVHRFREELVTDQELADAKAYLTGILPLQMETNEGMAAMLMEMHLYQLGDDFIARYPEIINAVTKAEIQAAAQRYLSDEIYALSIAGPYSRSN